MLAFGFSADDDDDDDNDDHTTKQNREEKNKCNKQYPQQQFPDMRAMLPFLYVVKLAKIEK